MDLRIDAILCSKLGKEIFDTGISNVHAGCIWPAGRRFPTPSVNLIWRYASNV